MPNPLPFDSPQALAQALRDAADNHHTYEQALGHPDADWPIWYASYLWSRYPATPSPSLGAFLEGDLIPDHSLPSRLKPR